MANVPQDLKYSKDHEWVRSLNKERVRIGITDFAQKQLGDIVYVELPKVDDTFDFSEPIGSIESVKAVSEVYTPVSGKIAAVNETLNDSPEETNTDPYGEGWLVELTLSNPKELDELLSAAEYEQYVKEETS
ncbi:glycine cleavage system protein GcvH [Kitasatospora sp. NPDC050543]|uniref:glycine cleavage system protein GcvH n=1 Tax=Kitasatospora sp. NPDC050543 TaxID=3364054 RepID=UPI0037AD01E5